ncbi:ABC transporter [Streptomyces physcomitrii]|uniref:ABC transporter n=1 Tax=Streptomyces physcomitrii TaxID=2724184 RepID=A0ABX1H7Y1_9ACTN|nr:ABC transporter [Streptomyces physcomitrii]NKI44481.1 ABC transporter [Streptomyces physcomitrii]
MTALLRYHCALLLRSQRLIAPLLCYAAVLAIGIRAGEPVLDSLGWTAAALVPVAAWTARICVSGEPAAARACGAAAAGPRRVQLACLLTALLTSCLLGALATGFVSMIGEAAADDHRTPVGRLPAALAGLCAVLVCALVGTAVGALTSWPLVRSTGRAVTALTGAVVLALVLAGSPARTAITAMVTGSQRGSVPAPVVPLLLALLLTGAAAATTCWASARRG